MFFTVKIKRHFFRIAAVAAAILIVLSLLFFSPKIRAAGTALKSTEGVRLPIIMYHSVCDNKRVSSEYIISPKKFEEDISYLKSQGYNSVFISDISSYVLNGTALPERPVAITLDDGHLNFITEVLPILQKYNFKATVSIVGSFTEEYTQNKDRNPTYAYMTWADIKEANDSGYAEIGNHTYNMHSLKKRNGCKKLPGESDEEYFKALEDDLLKLQTELSSKSEVTPQTFAYPFGAVSSSSVSVLKKLGFKAALTCSEKVNFITRDENCLYNLCRFNRASGLSTSDFMEKIE